MKNYLKKIAKSIWDGLYSIAEGMSTFNIYPVKKIKIPSEREGWEKDFESMKSDWENVGNDLRKTMEHFSSKKNLDSKL